MANNKEGYVNTHLSQPLRLHLTRPPSDQFPFKHFSYYTSIYDDFGSADSRKFRFTCQMRAQCLLRLKACQRHLWNSQFCVWRLTTVPVERTRWRATPSTWLMCDKCSCSPARIGLIETILCEDRFRKTGNLGSVADEGYCLDFNFTWAWGWDHTVPVLPKGKFLATHPQRPCPWAVP